MNSQMGKGNYASNWDKDYTPIETTYNDSIIKSRDDFYQLLGYKYTYEDIIRYINKPVNEIRTLEVGCGGARTSVYLAKKGMKVTGTEISSEGLRLADANFRAQGISNHTLLIDDICKTALPEKTYDVVMSYGLLEHFEDIDEPLNQMTRLLQPGGIHIHDIITKRFSVQTLSRIWNTTIRFMKRLLTLRWNNIVTESRRNFRHYENNYSLRRYEEALENSGVDILFSGGMIIWTFFALPKCMASYLLKWAIKHESLFRKIDRSGSKIMEVFGATWLIVGRKRSMEKETI